MHHRFLPALLLLVSSTSIASARTIKISAKHAILSGPDLQLVQRENEKPRQYLSGFLNHADTAVFRLHTGKSSVYRLFCMCRIAVRKDVEITVNSDEISTIIHPARNGETIAPTAVVPATSAPSTPLKCSDFTSHVTTVTYHAPQMKYSRNIMALNRIVVCIFT